MMKSVITLLIGITLLCSCKKEVAKKSYLLQLEFSDGGTHKSEGLIYEKNKKYDNGSYKAYDMNYNPHAIRFVAKAGLTLFMFKTQEEKLVGEISQTIEVENATFANGSSASCFGALELEGAYTRSGRRIKVDSGSFTFTWSNAEDFGKTDQVLTGTWTLKRE